MLFLKFFRLFLLNIFCDLSGVIDRKNDRTQQKTKEDAPKDGGDGSGGRIERGVHECRHNS